MIEEKDQITDLHPLVAARVEDWIDTADILAGPRALKASDKRERYLPRMPGQYVGVVPGTGRYVDEYDGYVLRATPLTARAQRARGGMVGMVARKPAAVDVPATVKPILRDLTLDGRSLHAVANEMLAEELAYAWGALAVSYDELLNRPYVRHYEHGDVTNWQLASAGGRVLPRSVVLREQHEVPGRFSADVGVQYKLFEIVPSEAADDVALYPLGGIVAVSTWREMKSPDGKASWVQVGPTEYPERLGRPLGEIPVIPAACQWTPRKPPMLELVQLILSHYRTSADYETLLHFAGAGSVLFGAGIPDDVRITVGGASAVKTNSPDSKLSWVTMSADGATPLREALDSKKTEMAVALARLLLSDQQRVAETAESQRIAFAGDDATLAASVVAVESSLDEVMAWCTWYMRAADTLDDARQSTKVQLNRDWIGGEMSASDLVQLGLEVDAGRMSKERQYFLAARGGLAEPGVSYEDEQAKIGAQPAQEPAPMFGDEV